MSSVPERGQHVSREGVAGDNGQRNIRGTAGDVGQPGGGERNNGPVPASDRGADISTTYPRRGAADDRR